MLDTQTSQQDLMVDGITVNITSLADAVSSICAAAHSGDSFSVCTLNLDHVDQIQRSPVFLAAYRRARFVTADGFPIVVLSRMLGKHITRTTGADLVEPVCAEAGVTGLPVFLLGSNTATLAIASQRLSAKFPGLDIVGSFPPGNDFDPYSPEADDAIARIRNSGAKLCFVALGAPKQELFAARCIDELAGTGMICIGAALDFIAGTQIRAPLITQKYGLEWLWRMMHNPKRLAPRYARCAAAVPRLLAATLPQIYHARTR